MHCQLIVALAVCFLGMSSAAPLVTPLVAAPAIPPALVTARSLQVVARNHNALAAPIVAAAPVRPVLAPAPVVRAAPLIASPFTAPAIPAAAALPAPLAFTSPISPFAYSALPAPAYYL